VHCRQAKGSNADGKHKWAGNTSHKRTKGTDKVDARRAMPPRSCQPLSSGTWQTVALLKFSKRCQKEALRQAVQCHWPGALTAQEHQGSRGRPAAGPRLAPPLRLQLPPPLGEPHEL
jgi:hypothetical protein